jgi:hypothetical protein
MELRRRALIQVSFFIYIFIMASSAQASWPLREELISRAWGTNNDQFGLERGDTIASDIYPELEGILSDNSIVVSDRVNMRTVVYSTVGILRDTDAWNEVLMPNEMVVLQHTRYLLGCCVVGYESNQLWMGRDKYYALINNSGVITQSSTSRPPTLGSLIVTKLSSTLWRFEIEYPDGIYIYEGSKDALKIDRLLRVNANLIMQNIKSKVTAYIVSEAIPVQPTEKKKYKIAVTSQWVKPNDEFGPVRVVGVERLPTLISHYGDAVLGPDGSIYVSMRTDANYKILRWKWME